MSDLVGTGIVGDAQNDGGITRAQIEREMRAKLNRETNGMLWVALWIGSSLGAAVIGAIWFFSTCTCTAF